jgi:type IV pilus assembly protein PilA
MLQKMKKRLKNQRGMTLVELLAVIVILGIISAIAVPSIGGLIDNTKKDAHIANAQQIANAAKLKVTSDNEALPAGGKQFPLKTLIDEKYIDNIKDPSDSSKFYSPTETKIEVKKNASGNIEYRVKLIANDGTTEYIDSISNFQDVSTLKKSDVNLHQ